MGWDGICKARRTVGAGGTPGTWITGLFVLFCALEVCAAELTVTVLSDSGAGSLRDAIGQANGTPEADTILFTGTAASGTLPLTTGAIQVTSDITLSGPGAETLAIDAGQLSRHFVVTAGSLTIADLALINGGTSSLESGGAIIMAGATVDLVRCRIEANQASRYGGAIEVVSGSFSAAACAFVGNHANRDSGVANFDGGSGLFINCTFANNTADGSAGAIGLFGSADTVTLKHCTLAGNTADADRNGAGIGGALARFAGALALESSIVSGNTGTNGAVSNLSGSMSASYCLLEETAGATVTGAANIVGEDPRLGSLGDWGGPTPLFPILAGSPAIDAGITTHSEAFDQRNAPFNREILAGQPDIGAFEYVADATVPLAWTTSSAGTHTNMSSFPATLMFSENVFGLAESDIVVTGAMLTASGWVEGANSYAIWLTPTGEGPVTIAIPADAAFDKGLNSNEASTPLVVTYDTTAPMVSLLGDATVTLEYGAAYAEAGATATDDVDGDISPSVQVDGTVDVSELGDNTLTYSVTDQAGNTSLPVVRTISIVDTTPPVMTLIGNPFVYTLHQSPYADSGASASDTYDGDLTNLVQVSGSVDTGTLGSYDLTYSVSDSSGNTAAPVHRTVVVVGPPETIYVDQANTTGIEDGTSAAPFTTLTQAMAYAQDGRSDTIRVRSGMYAENVALKYRVRLLAEDGPFYTHLTPANAANDLLIAEDETVVRGFTLSGSQGAGVVVPAGVAAEVTNCVVWDNGTGVRVETGALASLSHNTVLQNTGAGVACETGAFVNPLRNTILAENGIGLSAGALAVQAGGYNVYGGNTVHLNGPSFFLTDFVTTPLLVKGTAGNAYLRFDSPCRDAGDPGAAWEDPDGSRADIGATGGPYGTLDSLAPFPIISPSTLSGRPPLFVSFDGSASSDDAGIWTYLWDFDASDGVGTEAGGASASHTFTAPGSYVVTLRVQDNNGNWGQNSVTIAIDGTNSAPVISSATVSPRAGVAPFTALLSAAATDPEDDALTYSWEITGDGRPDAAAPSASISVPANTLPGSYPYIMTVTDYLGAKSTATMLVTVAGQSVLDSKVIAPSGTTTVRIDAIANPLQGAELVVGRGVSVLPHVLTIGLATQAPPFPPRTISPVLDGGPWNVTFQGAVRGRLPLSMRPARPSSLQVYRFSTATQSWTEQGISNIAFEDDGDTGLAVFNTTRLGLFIATVGSAPADVDQSGDVNAVDVQYVINSVLGLPVPFDCDTNGDGMVNAQDTQLVINASLGIVPGK